MTDAAYELPVAQLLTYGDCRKLPAWPEKLDYLLLGFGPEHIPDLIRMATDEELLWADSESLKVWAPAHAWRTLGQLRAESAIEPLIGLLHLIDDEDDDWVGEDMPTVLRLIGRAAIPALRAYILDEIHGLWATIAAVEALSNIAQKHPDAKPECVAALVEALERYPDNDPTLNAFIISNLRDLQAVRWAQLIERAFAANAVDLSVGGDWEDLQIDWGWKIARETPEPEGGWLRAEDERRKMMQQSGRQPAFQPRLQQPPSAPSRKDKAKAKAKRKEANKSRKKNRKK